MQSVKQLGEGLLLGLISLVVVVGGISLALAEGYVPQPPFFLATPTAANDFPTSEFAPGTLDFLLSPYPTDTPFAAFTLFTETPTPRCPIPAGWIVVVVAPGETLDMLAARYQTTADLLKSGNCLISSTLLPGYDLYVPPAVASTVPATACGHSSTWVKYTVQSGDNLFRISQLYRTTVAELKNANCLSSDTIYAGQILWVPNVPTSTPAATATILTIEFDTATVAPTSTPEPTNTSEPTATTAPPPTATVTATPPPPSDTPPPTTP
jgi:LysM repeat protein